MSHQGLHSTGEVACMLLLVDDSRWNHQSSPVADCGVCGYLHLSLPRLLMSNPCGPCRGAFWGSVRAGAQPMFHTHHLTAYAETINQAVDDMIVNLDSCADKGEQVDMRQQLGRLTMQIIGAAAFG